MPLPLRKISTLPNLDQKNFIMLKTSTKFDSPWKDIIERYFPAFMKFFFPKTYKIIDWNSGYEFLDNELQKVVRDAKLGRRLADKLVKVRQTNGQLAILYIHLEVQGQYDENFGERMFVYNYRFFDRYHHPIISLAILGDERKDWHPQSYSFEVGECRLLFEFPVVKLLDYLEHWEKLERSNNLFSIVVQAHLRSLETRRSPNRRLYWKQELFKMLHESHYRRQQILDLFWFMDWVLALPTAQELQFNQFVNQYEEKTKVRYVTSIEKRGIEKGLLQGVQQGKLRNLQENVVAILHVRFKRVPQTLAKQIQTINDADLLSQLLKEAVVVKSLSHFKQQIGIKI